MDIHPSMDPRKKSSWMDGRGWISTVRGSTSIHPWMDISARLEKWKGEGKVKKRKND